MKLTAVRLLPLALLLALTSVACEFSKTGEEGNLRFQYSTDDRLIPPTFNRPLATGLRVEVRVTDANTNEEVTVSSANSSATNILTVPMKSGSLITLQGESAGDADISIRTSRGVTDTIGVSVADIDKAELTNPGPLLQPVDGTPQVLMGAKVPFPVTLKDASGKLLIGYGNLPVTVDPATAGSKVDRVDAAHVYLTFTELGDVMIRPQNGTPVPIRVIDPADVATLDVGPILGNDLPTELKLDSFGWIAVKGTTSAGDPVVGLADVATVTSETIAVCKIESEVVLGDGVFRVTPLAAGDCTVQAVHNGQTAAATFKVTGN